MINRASHTVQYSPFLSVWLFNVVSVQANNWVVNKSKSQNKQYKITTKMRVQMDDMRHFLCFSLTFSWRRPICSANQWTGFYMITASVLKGLKKTYQIFRIQQWHSMIKLFSFSSGITLSIKWNFFYTKVNVCNEQ